jgi:osmotically-inducible protein OsmY
MLDRSTELGVHSASRREDQMPATTKIKHAGRPDDDIARDIRQALKLDSDVPDERISVQVHSGIATLEGNVESSLQKEAAAADAKKVNGVRTVMNQIKF